MYFNYQLIIEESLTSLMLRSFVVKFICAALHIIAALSVDSTGDGMYKFLLSSSEKVLNFSLNLLFAITPPPPDIVGTFVSFTASFKYSH